MAVVEPPIVGWTYWISFCTTDREETWDWRTEPTWRWGLQPSGPGWLSYLPGRRRLVRLQGGPPAQLLSQRQHNLCWSSISKTLWLRQPPSTGSGLQKHNRNAASMLWHLSKLITRLSEYSDFVRQIVLFNFVFSTVSQVLQLPPGNISSGLVHGCSWLYRNVDHYPHSHISSHIINRASVTLSWIVMLGSDRLQAPKPAAAAAFDLISG